MKFCTKCGNQLAAGQRFCTRCGAPNKVAESQPAPAPVVEAPVTYVPEPAVVPEPVVEPDPMAVLFPESAAAVVPEPAPAPTPPREYSNILPMILALGNAGVINDIVDEPGGLSQEAVTSWAQDKLAALIHRTGDSEYQIVIADSTLDPSSYASLNIGSGIPASAGYGNWVVSVNHFSGGANESARVLERVFELLG